jgi:hypothetical protein
MMILGDFVQSLIFQDGASGHLGLGPLTNNAGIVATDMGAKFFMKRSIEVKSLVKTSEPENGHGIELLGLNIYISLTHCTWPELGLQNSMSFP